MEHNICAWIRTPRGNIYVARKEQDGYYTVAEYLYDQAGALIDVDTIHEGRDWLEIVASITEALSREAIKR